MLCLVRAKACKRCGGDLSIECDAYGIFIECIQCGATWNKTDLKLNASDVETVKAIAAKPQSTSLK